MEILNSQRIIVFSVYLHHTANSIAAFNRFGTLYNDEVSNDVTEQNNQNDVIVITPNSTIMTDVQNKLFLQSNHKKDLL